MNFTKKERFELSHAAIARAQVQLEKEQKDDVVVHEPATQDAQLIKEDLEDVLTAGPETVKQDSDIIEIDASQFR